jgi:hypothetical protein
LAVTKPHSSQGETAQQVTSVATVDTQPSVPADPDPEPTSDPAETTTAGPNATP